MARDYYRILGVSADATLDEIKSAYRRKAKECHPDHSGEGCEPFLAIREAYEVLGDAGRRRAYDAQVARAEERVQHAAREARPEPLRRRRCPVEPLVPTGRASSPRDAFPDPPFPSFIGELFGRPWSDLDTPIEPTTRRGIEEIQVEVTLTREQALQGGGIRVRVPMLMRCPVCGGRGGSGFFECLHCFGSGTVVDERPVEIAFPGGVVDGGTGSVSLSRPGMRDLSLVVHFRVEE